MLPNDAIALALNLCNFILNPLSASIYRVHPNDLATGLIRLPAVNEEARLPVEWSEWWKWSADRKDVWRRLVEISSRIRGTHQPHGHASPVRTSEDLRPAHCELPAALKQLLSDADVLSLPRQPCMIKTERVLRQFSLKGMSPKKIHEVSRMTTFVVDLLDTLRKEHHVDVRHIVDIGSGQGYLSRALCCNRNVQVLALDSSQHQTKRSFRHFQSAEAKGTLTHRTLWLGEQPTFGTHPGCRGSSREAISSLDAVIDQWIREVQTCADDEGLQDDKMDEQLPVLFVALHACGSLTPYVFQEALKYRWDNSSKGQKRWSAVGAVVVGCCYNLMREEDFPLSNVLKQHSPEVRLSPSHLQLASQIPSEWLGENESSTERALKSIVFRALLTPFLARSLGDTIELPRLGKVKPKVHESFERYIECAGEKAGLDLLNCYKQLAEDMDLSAATLHRLSNHIKTLHALRCILGPPVESLIIIDRYLWLKEEIEGSHSLDVRIVNIFDQEQSGRNVALVLEPVLKNN